MRGNGPDCQERRFPAGLRVPGGLSARPAEPGWAGHGGWRPWKPLIKEQ